MDFHSLPRRELQALCKKYRIPANMTNVAMADALQSLKSEAGWAEETMQEEPPREVQASSVRKASARRAAAPPEGASVERQQQPASPLPRARRVTAKASEIRILVSEGEGEEEEEKKEESAEMTTPMPAVKRSTAKKPTSRNTRRGASKKENAESAEEGPLEAAKTPATRNGRRTAARRGDETPDMVEQEGQDALFSPRISTRRTRQSSKSTAVVDLNMSTLRRSTRIRARTSVPEMMEDLVPEAKQVEEGVEIKDSSEKTLDLETGDVSDLKETEGIEKYCDLVVADAVDVVKDHGVSAETIEIDDASEEEIVAQQEVEKGIEINIPIERDDDAGEKLSDLQEEIGGVDRNQDNIIHSNDFEQECVSQHQLDVDAKEGMTQEIEDCEQDSNEVFENVILPQHPLDTDAKEDGMIQETEGSDEQLVAEAEGSSEVDAKEGMTQEIEDCEQDSNEVFENVILPQHPLDTDAKEDGMIQETEGSDEKLVAEAEGSSEVDDAKEGMTQEIEDCERDSNEVFENVILPQHPLDTDAKEDGMIQETEGSDEQLVAEAEGSSEVDAEEGMTQEIEDCEQDSTGVFENAILPQRQLAVDAKGGMTQKIGHCEQFSNELFENVILPQLATDTKKDGTEDQQQVAEVERCSEVEQDTKLEGNAGLPVEGLVSSLENLEIARDAADWQSEKEQEEVSLDVFPEDAIPGETSNSTCLNQVSAIPEVTESASAVKSSEIVAEVERCCEVEQETNQEGTAASSWVEGLPVDGLVSSLENLEIASDAADWQSEKEEEEVSLDLFPDPGETSNSTCLNQVSEIPEVAESASAVKSSEIVAEELQVSPVKISSEVRGVIASGLENSEKKSQASAIPEAIESAMSIPESSSDGGYEITSELKGEESDAEVNNDSSAELAVEGVGCGEMRVENDAEDKSEKNLDVDVDYSLLSMRKLRTILKEKKLSNNDKKVEGRRSPPLAEINDNQC